MANVIVKSEERKRQEDQMLSEFGHDPRTASAEDREKAEYIAAESQRMKKEWGV